MVTCNANMRGAITDLKHESFKSFGKFNKTSKSKKIKSHFPSFYMNQLMTFSV